MGKAKGTSAMRKVTPRPEHKERSQPAHRKRFGLLEKHKDYVVRAKNYHFKEKRLQALKEKAEFRNPDEFYFKMLNSKTKNGVHKANKNNGPLAETVKILKTQDLGYVTMKATAEVKKVDKLSQNLHFVGMQKPKSHIVFVDDEEEAEVRPPRTASFHPQRAVPVRCVNADSLYVTWLFHCSNSMRQRTSTPSLSW